MDIVATIVSCSEASKLMEPRQCSFHRPAKDAESAAVLRVAFRQHRLDAAPSKRLPVGFGIIPPVSLHGVWPFARTARFAADRFNGVD